MELDLSAVSRLPGESQEFAFQEELPPFHHQGEDISFSAPVQVSGRATNEGQVIVLEGQIIATLLRTCARCLLPVPEEIAAPLEEKIVLLSPDETPPPESDEEFHVLRGQTFDLTEVVLKSIILSMAIKPVCRTDCQGLWHTTENDDHQADGSEVETDVDPRFAVLKKLLDEKS